MLGGRGWKNLPHVDNDFCDWLATLSDLSLIAPFGNCGHGHMLTAVFGGQTVAKHEMCSRPRAPSHASCSCSVLNEKLGAHKSAAPHAQPRPGQLHRTDNEVDDQDDAQVYCIVVASQDNFPGIFLSFYLWRHFETRIGEK